MSDHINSHSSDGASAGRSAYTTNGTYYPRSGLQDNITSYRDSSVSQDGFAYIDRGMSVSPPGPDEEQINPYLRHNVEEYRSVSPPSTPRRYSLHDENIPEEQALLPSSRYCSVCDFYINQVANQGDDDYVRLLGEHSHHELASDSYIPYCPAYVVFMNRASEQDPDNMYSSRDIHDREHAEETRSDDGYFGRFQPAPSQPLRSQSHGGGLSRSNAIRRITQGYNVGLSNQPEVSLGGGPEEISPSDQPEELRRGVSVPNYLGVRFSFEDEESGTPAISW